MCLGVLNPSRSKADRRTTPNNPRCKRRSADKGARDTGKDMLGAATPKRARGKEGCQTYSAGKDIHLHDQLETPLFRSVKARSCSWLNGHRMMYGMTCRIWLQSEYTGSCRILIGPKAGADSTAHHQFREHGQQSWSFRISSVQ